MSNRRAKIEAMLVDDPHDLFLRYSLAMEWQKEGAVEQSRQGLRELMAESPPYVPAFFMLAKSLAEGSDTEGAREALRSGIEVARAQGNHHAAGEMSEFLATLGSL